MPCCEAMTAWTVIRPAQGSAAIHAALYGQQQFLGVLEVFLHVIHLQMREAGDVGQGGVLAAEACEALLRSGEDATPQLELGGAGDLQQGMRNMGGLQLRHGVVAFECGLGDMETIIRSAVDAWYRG